MAEFTKQYIFSADTGQIWGSDASRCCVLYDIWAAIAEWCNDGSEFGLDVDGLLSFEYTLNADRDYSANEAIANCAAFKTPGIGANTELNKESGWLNRCQYLPTKGTLESLNDMLTAPMSGLTIQERSTTTSGVTSIGLRIANESNYDSNMAVKISDLYFEVTYNDTAIRALSAIMITVLSVPEIPASGGAVVVHGSDYTGSLPKQYIGYEVKALYTDDPLKWVDITSEATSYVSSVCISAGTLGTTIKEEKTKIDDFILTVNYGGLSASSSSYDVYQQENELTTNERTRNYPESGEYTENEGYDIALSPYSRNVDSAAGSTTLVVSGVHFYDIVTSSRTVYENAIDSAYTSNASITDTSWHFVSASTVSTDSDSVMESAATTYSENVSWITGVSINGRQSTVRYTENNTFSARTGVVNYYIVGHAAYNEDFTLTQAPQSVALDHISVVIDQNSIPVIPAYGGSVDCSDIIYTVYYVFNNSDLNTSYTSSYGTWLDTPPENLDIDCTGVTAESKEDNVDSADTFVDKIWIEAYDSNYVEWDSDSGTVYQQQNELKGHNYYNGDNAYTTSGSSSYTTSQYYIDCDPDEKNAGVSSDSYDVLVSGYVKTTLHEMEWPRYYETTVYWSGYTSMYSATTTESGLTAIDDLENAQSSQHDGDTASTKGTCVFVSVTNNNPAWLTIGGVDSTTDLSTIEIDENSGLAGRSSVVTYKLVEDESNQTTATHEISQEGVNAWIRFVENGTVVDISTLNVGPYAGDDTSIDVYSNVDWRITASSQDISVVPATDDAGRTNITITLPDNIGNNNQTEVYTISAISTTYPSIYDVLTINQSALKPTFDIDVDYATQTTGSGAGSTTASVSVVPSGLTYTLYPGNLDYSVDGRVYIGPSTFTGDISSMTLNWGAVDYEDPSRVLFISGETSTYNLTDVWEIVQESGATTPMKNVYVRVPVVMGYKGDGSGLIPTSTDILDNFIVTINGSYSAQKDPSTTDYGNGYVIGNGGNTLGSYMQLSGLQVQNISELTGFTFGWRAETGATDYRYLPISIKTTASTPTWYSNNYFVGEAQDKTTETLSLGVYATITESNGNILINFEGVRLGDGEDGPPVISYSTSALTGMFLSLSNPNDIPASGGTISSTSYNASGTVTVTHYWTNGSTTTEEVDHTDDITIMWGSPVSAGSLYNYETLRNYIGDLTATASCTYNDVTETDSASTEIYQEANTYESAQTGTGRTEQLIGSPSVYSSWTSDYWCYVTPSSFNNEPSTTGTVEYSVTAGHNENTQYSQNAKSATTTSYRYEYKSGYIDNVTVTGSWSSQYTIMGEEDSNEVSDNVTVGTHDSWITNITTGTSASATYSANNSTSSRNGSILFENASHTATTDTLYLTQDGVPVTVSSVTLIVSPAEYIIPASGGSFGKNDITITQIEVEFSDGTTSQDQNLVTLSWSDTTSYSAQGLSGETSERILGNISVTAASVSDSSVYDVATVTVKQAACTIQTTSTESWTGAPTGVTYRNTGVTSSHTISLGEEYREVGSGGGGYAVTIYAYTTPTTTGQSATTYTRYSYNYTAYTSGHITCGTTTSTVQTGGTWSDTYSIEGTAVRKKGVVTTQGSFTTASTNSQGTSLSISYGANTNQGAARTGTTVVSHENAYGSVTASHETRQAKGRFADITFTYDLSMTPSTTPISLDADEIKNFASTFYVYKYANQQVTAVTTTSSNDCIWSISGPAASCATITNGQLVANNVSQNSVTGTVYCTVPVTITEYNNGETGSAANIQSNLVYITIAGQPVTPTTGSLTINGGNGPYEFYILNYNSHGNVDLYEGLDYQSMQSGGKLKLDFDDSSPLQCNDVDGGSFDCSTGNTYYVWEYNTDTDTWVTSQSFIYSYTDITLTF